MYTRRALLNAREFCFPMVLQRHGFMVAVSQVSVYHGERSGSAPDPFVWDQGSRKKQRKVDIRFMVRLAWFLARALGAGSWWVSHVLTLL